MDKDQETIRAPFKVTFTKHEMRGLSPLRRPTDWELGILERLLSEPFPGRDELRRQLPSLMVAAECVECPTLDLIAEQDSSNQARGVPYKLSPELYGKDIDGMDFFILLFARDGYLSAIDAFRGDGEPWLSQPDPSSMGLISEQS